MSLESYTKLMEPEEYIMDIADEAAEATETRLTHDQVFDDLRKKTTILPAVSHM